MSDTPTGLSRQGRAQSLRPCRFLIATILLLLACGAPAIAQSEDPRHTLLWRISGNGLDRPSYLYGTMHVTDERAFDFSDSVLLKLQECDAFAMELSLDSLTRLLFQQVFWADSSANDVRDWLTDEQEKDLDRQLQISLGMPLEQLAHVRPWLLSQFLVGPSEPDIAPDMESIRNFVLGKVKKQRPVALDPYLYRLARGEGKKIVALESVDEQIMLFDTVPYEHQVRLFLGLDETESGTTETGVYEQMVRLYRDGDLDALLEILENSTTAEFFLRKLLVDRNHTMVARIVPQIASTTMFIAVGAGHLPGPEGLIQLLEKQGFSVTPVQAVRTGLSRDFVEKPFATVWTRFEEKEGAFSIELPGDPIRLPDGPGTSRREMSLREYMSADLARGIVYDFSYFDRADLSSSDTATLSEFVRIMASTSGMLIESEVDSTSIYPARTAVIRQPDGTVNRLKILVRGQRIYLLTAFTQQSATELADMEHYFASFTPLENPPMALRTVVSDTLQVTAQLPALPVISYDTSLYPRARITMRGTAVDPSTLYSVRIDRHSFPRFFRAASDSALFAEEIATLRRFVFNDTLYRYNRTSHGGASAVDLEYGVVGQQMVERIRMVRHGRDLYWLTIRLPRDSSYSRIAESIFASIELTGERVESRSGNRIPDIVALLDSIDQSREIDPSLGLLDIVLDSIETAFAYDILKQPRHDDSVSMGLRLLLLNNLAHNADSTIIPHLREIYPTLGDLPEHRHAVRYLLAKTHTAEGNRWLAELFVDEKEVVDADGYYLMMELWRDLPTAKFLFPTALPLVEDSRFRNHLLWLLISCLDSGVVVPADLASRTEWLADIATRTMLEKDEVAFYSVTLLLDLLERLPVADKTLELFRAALQHEQNYIAYSAALALLRQQQPLDAGSVERFGADPAYRLPLYRLLDSLGKLELFPQQYATQRAISEAALVDWLRADDDGTAPDSISFVDALVVTVGDTRYRAYLFKFFYDGMDEWTIGLGSLQPIDPNRIDFAGPHAGSRYKAVGDLSRREHVNLILDQ